jgi:hypothetical protein
MFEFVTIMHGLFFDSSSGLHISNQINYLLWFLIDVVRTTLLVHALF